MLFGKKSIIDVREFLQGMQKSLDGVFLIRQQESGISCTGWAITEDLIVIPDFMEKPGDRFTCYPYTMSDKNGSFEAERLEPTIKSKGAVLLKAFPQSPLKNLSIEFMTSAVNDIIYILQYPRANQILAVSFGKILSIDNDGLSYDAETEYGASGGPLVDARTGKLIGMHMSASINRNANYGQLIGNTIDSLHVFSCWSEIKEVHRIAESSAGVKKTTVQYEGDAKQLLQQAALTWTIDSTKLSEAQKTILRPYIDDTYSDEWIFDTEERKKILANIPKLPVSNNPAFEANQKGQLVIQRILKGAPFDLSDIDEDSLAYWLQASQWLKDIFPDFPSPADINRAMEKRRVRSELDTLAGPSFSGRTYALDKMRAWYSGTLSTLMIYGIGGIGKSSLISFFLKSLPQNTPIFWLDFDRVDLAPDDGASIVKLLTQQAASQVKDYRPPSGLQKEWSGPVRTLAQELTRLVPPTLHPVVILDGFEIAQYVKQYQQIWSLLELLLKECPTCKIIVSGRSKVNALKIGDQHSQFLQLGPLEQQEAEQFLKGNGIDGQEVVDKVVQISRGIPLVLKLAVHDIKTGGIPEELPEALPETMIQGYLYRRILDRVVDYRLKKLCKSALVVRRLTLNIIEEVFSNQLPEGYSAAQAFESLSREMGLVLDGGWASSGLTAEGSTILQLRPEVRSATIKILELEAPDLVRSVDEKIADYYQKRDLDIVENRAEFIYHLLRLGRLDEAKTLWREECAPLLKYAGEEIANEKEQERLWLEHKIGESIGESEDNLVVWETEATKQIFNLLSRNQISKMDEVLSYRKERSHDSRLRVYDAFQLYLKGESTKAIDLLASGRPINRYTRRNELLLLGLCYLRAEKPAAADFYLSQIESNDWNDHKNDNVLRLALLAARIRLTVSPEKELVLAGIVMKDPKFSGNVDLRARYLILPYLIKSFSSSYLRQSAGSVFSIPASEKDLQSFASDFGEPDFHDIKDLRSAFEHYGGPAKDLLPLIISELRTAGRFRWKLVTDSLMLSAFTSVTLLDDRVGLLELSILATLTAFHGAPLSLPGSNYSDPTIAGLQKRILLNTSYFKLPPLNDKRWEVYKAYLEHEKRVFDAQTDIMLLSEQMSNDPGRQPEILDKIQRQLPNLIERDIMSTVFYMVSPDPLEMLCKLVLGIPENLKI